jgi:hypothetical protein
MIRPFTVFIARIETNSGLVRPNERRQGQWQLEYVRERGDATGRGETASAESVGDLQQLGGVGI